MGYAPEAIYNAGHGTGFETFCMERNEYFTPGSSYYYAISEKPSMAALASVIPFPLERRYSTGCSLQATFPDTTTPAQIATHSAAELQATIWWLEGERD